MMNVRKCFILGLCLIALVMNGCKIGTNESEDELDKQLRDIIAAKGLNGDPTTSRDLPSIDSPKAQLGMQLFYTKALGGDMDAACVTCHHPALGGGDNLPLSIGTEAINPDLLGPGRLHSSTGTNHDGGPTVPRNAPSTFNVGLWDVVLFLDGRVESLDQTDDANGAGDRIRTPDSAFGATDPNAGQNLTVAQARFPVTSPEEMRGHTLEHGNSNDVLRTHLTARLKNQLPAELANSTWLEEFRNGFEQPQGTADQLITFANIVEAIGEYERSQVFVDTPWKSYVLGDDNALTKEQKRGALIFFKSVADGGANCASCHSGDFFTDEKFHNIAFPQIGRGKGNNNGTTNTADFGRFRETGDMNDLYAFRTPTLLNAEVTGPYGHAGAYSTLEDVVRHHLDPEKAIKDFKPEKLEQQGIQTNDWFVNTMAALDVLKDQRSKGMEAIENVHLNQGELKDLIAFLRALTDLCVKDRNCLSPWIPADSLPDPDGLRLNAIDEKGNKL